MANGWIMVVFTSVVCFTAFLLFFAAFLAFLVDLLDDDSSCFFFADSYVICKNM